MKWIAYPGKLSASIMHSVKVVVTRCVSERADPSGDAAHLTWALALTRATARNPRRSEEPAGETTNHTNYTNQDILSTLFIRVIRVIRGCRMRAWRAHNTD
jgi:hypothetical protein